MITPRGISKSTAIGLALELVDALDAAHTIGILHRDIKPHAELSTYGGGRAQDHSYPGGWFLERSQNHDGGFFFSPDACGLRARSTA
jgi:hypothetical protein